MKIIRSLGAIVLASAAVATTASAEERGYSALLCSVSASSNVVRTYLGLETGTPASAHAFCGAAPIVGADVNRIQATVFDRNHTDNLCCTMSVVTADSFAIATASRCTSDSTDSQLLTFIPPVNVAGSVHLQCTIPGLDFMGGVSRIATYRVRSTP